jgi:hypothetical protein
MIDKMEIVNKVLLVVDPMGLIYEEDEQYLEYQSETKEIVKYLENNVITIESLARFIRNVFVWYFETCLELGVCELIADCIMKNLTE